MFLKKLQERNQNFIKAAALLHQEKKIPPNCYVIDLDTLKENSGIMAEEAARFNLKVLPMTKQLGRNPYALDAIVKGGLPDRFVAVDIQCALAIKKAGHHVGHLGHLVQISESETEIGVKMSPDFWTVFNFEKVEEISKSCIKLGKTQKILVRIFDGQDNFYKGHEGGFPAEDIIETAQKINSYDNVEFSGITTFPALLLDEEVNNVVPTKNFETLKQTADKLRNNGFNNIEINAPGTTSSIVVPLLAETGATQIEPGNGLTGTTPLHALKDLPERPALLYVSEISHFHNDRPYCFGGGLYIDPVFPPYPVKCLTGANPDILADTVVDIDLPASNAIDYYGILNPEKGNNIRVGDTVIMGFRAQIFVTRAYVAAVEGISKEDPKVKGITDSTGREVEWPWRW